MLSVATLALRCCLFLAASLVIGEAFSQSPSAISETITSSAQGDDESSSIRLFRQPDITARDVDACVIGEVQPQSERF